MWRGVGGGGRVSPHPRRHLPGRVFLAHCLAQTGEKATASASYRESISSHDRANIGGESMKIIKAIYNFIVGDMVILIGVALAVTILALINNVGALAPSRAFQVRSWS